MNLGFTPRFVVQLNQAPVVSLYAQSTSVHASRPLVDVNPHPGNSRFFRRNSIRKNRRNPRAHINLTQESQTLVGSHPMRGIHLRSIYAPQPQAASQLSGRRIDEDKTPNPAYWRVFHFSQIPPDSSHQTTPTGDRQTADRSAAVPHARAHQKPCPQNAGVGPAVPAVL